MLHCMAEDTSPCVGRWLGFDELQTPESFDERSEQMLEMVKASWLYIFNGQQARC